MRASYNAGMRRIALFLTILSLLVSLAGYSAAEKDWVSRVVLGVQDARMRAGHETLDRRAAADAAAQAFANEVASRPESERMSQSVPIEHYLEQAGIRRVDKATLHLDMGRGYTDWGAAFGASWAKFKSGWNNAMNPDYDAIGVATATAEDGWVIFVAIMIDDLALEQDLKELERRVIEGVNEIRRERGIPELRPHETLARAARMHSEQMAKFDFFSHTGLEGTGPDQRVQRVGIQYRAVAENIYANQGANDPVDFAIQSWWNSDGHRKNMIDRRFSHTAVGIALTEDGMYYVTQLFLLEQD